MDLDQVDALLRKDLRAIPFGDIQLSLKTLGPKLCGLYSPRHRLVFLCDICYDSLHRVRLDNMDLSFGCVIGESLIDDDDLCSSRRGLALEEAVLVDEAKSLRGGRQAPAMLI